MLMMSATAYGAAKQARKAAGYVMRPRERQHADTTPHARRPASDNALPLICDQPRAQPDGCGVSHALPACGGAARRGSRVSIQLAQNHGSRRRLPPVTVTQLRDSRYGTAIHAEAFYATSPDSTPPQNAREGKGDVLIDAALT